MSKAKILLCENERLQGVLETAGAVCHELNQPLMAVSGLSALISMNLSEDDPVCEMAGKMEEQVSKMGKITQKLMRIMRYEQRDKRIIDEACFDEGSIKDDS